MATATVICVRNLATALLALLVVACGASQAPLGEIYNDGYRELESGNLGVAKEIAADGLQRARSAHQPAWVWAFEVLEAEVLVGRRQIAAALDRLDTGLSAKRPHGLVHARALMTRGYALCLAPDGEDAYSRSETDLVEAARIAHQRGDEEIAAEIALRRGGCAILRNNPDTAEAFYRESMEIARRQSLSLIEAQAAGNLGNLRIRMSEYDDAARWLRRSQELASGLPADGLRTKNLGDLGWSYYRLGDYERAAQILYQAELLARELGYVGDRLIALRNLGRTHHRQGNYERANRIYTRAAAIAGEIEDQAESAEALANIEATRAALALEHGRHDEAAARAEAALRIQVEHGFPGGRQRTLLLQGEIWERREELSRAAALYDEVIRSPNAEPYLVWEARADLARVHARADRPAEAEAEYRRAFELMETSLTQLVATEHQLPFFSNLGRFYDEYVDFLVARGRATEALQAADDSRARLLQERLLGASTSPSSIDYAGLARDLDALLLFYWTAPVRSFLWIVAADGVELVPLPQEEVLEALVKTYQERILRSRDPLGEADPEGVELYRLLVQPALAAMAAADRVVIVPDGPLHQLNFETLMVPGSRPHYLIEDVVLARAPSLRLLRTGTESPPARESSLLVFGDPISPDEEFPPLPFVGGEVDAIAKLFDPQNRRIYSGPQATPSTYSVADPNRFTYVHFAAHALANPVAPLDSAVVLSADGDEYKLYARDLVSIPLNAELVTLSACRSAGGRTFAGEGLVGLSWAFLSAGARHVIGGLWQVEDASTAELMEHLYRELVAGADPAVALRRAKLQLLRSDTAYRKPYYWAPFVVYASRVGGSRQ